MKRPVGGRLERLDRLRIGIADHDPLRPRRRTRRQRQGNLGRLAHGLAAPNG
jgi:hypothetical protein